MNLENKFRECILPFRSDSLIFPLLFRNLPIKIYITKKNTNNFASCFMSVKLGLNLQGRNKFIDCVCLENKTKDSCNQEK